MVYNIIPAKHFSNAHYTTTPSTVLQNISNYNCDKIVSLCFILNSEKNPAFLFIFKGCTVSIYCIIIASIPIVYVRVTFF